MRFISGGANKRVRATSARHGVKKGTRVAVNGLGGLGHLAVQFAKAMGADVAVLSSSANKEQDAKKLGASQFVNTSDKKQVSKVAGSFDIVVVTAVYKGMEWDKLLNFVAARGHLIVLSGPEEPITLNAFPLLMKEVSVTGSIIGSPKIMREMLEFAAKHKVAPMIEKFPMAKVNEGIAHVLANTVRYRVVLENYEDKPAKM